MYIDNYSLMLETIYDNKDSTSSEGPAPKSSNLINGDNKVMRIGIPTEYRMDGVSEDFIHHWENVSSDL
jgi:aspartyl-tRNA(Asn)/glutamyl-tRNA(Gln) amidotransferase subunit A